MLYIIFTIILLWIVRKALLSKTDISQIDALNLVKAGGKLVDVRSPEEFRANHVDGAVNIPLEALPGGLHKIGISTFSPIVLCCSTGMRAARGKKILVKAGFTRVHNAGSMRK